MIAEGAIFNQTDTDCPCYRIAAAVDVSLSLPGVNIGGLVGEWLSFPPRETESGWYISLRVAEDHLGYMLDAVRRKIHELCISVVSTAKCIGVRFRKFRNVEAFHCRPAPIRNTIMPLRL